MAQQSGSWEGKPVRAFLIRVAAFVLPLVFAILVAWQLTRILPTPRTWPGMIFWWLLVMASSTMALRFADRFAKRLMPLAVLMKLSLVFPDKAPNRFGVSLKSGSAHSLEELLERAERAGRHDDLTEAAETILALGAALNAHDPRTRGHGDRVRAYADMLGEEMGYTDEERNKLKWAAMLHDIGKLRVPSEVINSPGKLTDEEWVIMRNHPDWGMELAAPLLPWLGEFAAAIGQHHERFDGNGYPNGIAGEDIGLAARITSVADTYDVMTSVRSYKEARPASEAREELARCAGSQFDPIVVRAFLNISLGRQRWVAGPLSWLAQVPFFQSALQGATTLAQNAAVAAQTGLAATAIGATAVVAPAIIDTPNLEPETALPSIVITANDDSLTLPEDGSDAVFVLGNDDVEASSLTIVSGPSHGTATLSAAGTLTYVPDPEFSGIDTLTYEVCGASGECDTAVLSINVTAVNDPPDLLAVPASLDEDTSTVIDVLSAVVDIDGDPTAATITLVGVADEGLILSNGDGTFTYTPPPDFFGTDSFTVQVCDEGGACELRSLSISVAPLNDAPTVDVVVPSVTEDTPVSIFVDAADADGDLLTTSVIAGPTSGTAVVDIDGSVAYSPGTDFFGSESITLEVCDPITCITEVVGFTVIGVNDPPVVPGPGPLVTAEETMISFDPLAGASDPEGGVLSLDGFDAVSANGGTITLGSLEYTPAIDFVGLDTFTYTVGDPDGGATSVTVTVTVTGENDPPAPVADSYVAAEDTTLIVIAPGVLTNDADVDGDSLTALLGTPPSPGSVVLAADGSFTYTPAADFVGPDGFSYVVDDGAGGTSTATVVIEVAPVNDAPIAFDDIASTSGPGAVVVAVLANDIDLEGDFDPTSVTVAVPPSKGTAVANPDGTIDYTPDSGETGSDSFVYEICDLSGLCDVATVTMGLKGPDAVDDTATVGEDGSVTILATANDTDPDADLDPTSAVVHIDPTNGAAVANGDGSFEYTPAPDFVGSDSFEYKVCDLAAACDAATVTITVTAVNDAPVANDDTATVAEDSVAGVTFSVLANDADVDLDVLSLASYDGSTITDGMLTDNGGGSFTYVPDPNFFGVENFAYDVTDGALTDTGTVTITVTNVPDAPEAQDDAYATNRDTPVVTAAPGVLGNDTDYDGDPLTAALASPPANGGVTLNPDGSFTYTPSPGYVGSDSFTYTADDGFHPPVPATVDVTVDDGIVARGWFFGDSGPAPETYAFVGAPPPLGNPDPDGDGNPGLTILNSGGGEAESDPLKYQQWLLTPTLGPVELNGPVTLDLWATVEFYEVDKDVDVTVWIHDCDAAGSVCGPALLNYDVHYDEFNGGVADFVNRQITLGSLDHTVAVGRSLRFRLQFDHEPMWVGMSADYPTEVTFTEANRPPATTPDSDALLEDGGPVNIDVLANDADPNLDPASLSIDTAASNGTATVVAGPTIDYDPNPDYFGVDTFTYEVCDTSAACSTETVTVTVTPVNDAPSFTVGSDQVVLEDAGGQTIDPHPTAISPGPPNESGQSVNFNVTNDNPALFKNAPTINNSGRLQYEVWDDVSGSATVTVSISDDGGTANGGVDTSADQTFTITVTGVNDQPAFNDGPNVSVDEDSGPHTVAAWASAVTAGAPEEEPPAQTLTVNILTNDNPALFTAGPGVDAATGNLTFTLNPDAFGQANIDINLTDDGGTANGGIDTSVTRSFTIDVDPVNDPPSFLSGGDVSVLEDSGAYVAPWASAISMGPASEATQTGTFNVSGNSNPGLFSAGPAVAPDGTLTFTPAADGNGTASITVELQDNGGTGSGGDDTSASATFTITVTAVNDQPGFLGGPDVTVNEDSGPASFLGWATAITAGAPDEEPPVQGITFEIATNDNLPLFVVPPAVDPASGELTFTPTANLSGTANIQLRVTDDGGTANGGDDTSGVQPFKITVNSVNDAPSFTKGADQNVLVDSGAASIVGWATGISPGPADESGQSVTFNTTGNTNPGLFSAPPLVASTGTLVYTPAAGQFGTATITIEAQDDGGTVNGGVDTSASQTFDITVTKPQIVISEFRPDGPLGADDEFVEIYNAGSTAINITGWKLHVTSGVDVDFYTFPAFTLNPGQHYLVAHPSVAAGLGADGVTSGVLYGPAWGDVQILTAGGSQIDAMHYGVGPTIGEGAPLESWVTTGIDGSFERRLGLNHGSCIDDEDNRSDFVRRHGVSTPQSSSAPLAPCGSPPTATNLVIAEFRTAGPAGFEDEFVEVFNPTGAAIDISFWQLELPGFGTLHTYQGGVIVPAGGRYVVAPGSGYPGFKDDTYNGGIAFPYLVQFGGHLELRTDTSALVDAVAWGGFVAEGTPLPDFSDFSTLDRSFDRGFNGCADLDSNIDDFIVSWQATPGTGICP